MVKIEIDISEEIEKVIHEAVESKMGSGGLLRFIRDVTINEVKKSGIRAQVKRHETQLMQLLRRHVVDG